MIRQTIFAPENTTKRAMNRIEEINDKLNQYSAWKKTLQEMKILGNLVYIHEGTRIESDEIWTFFVQNIYQNPIKQEKK